MVARAGTLTSSTNPRQLLNADLLLQTRNAKVLIELFLDLFALLN